MANQTRLFWRIGDKRPGTKLKKILRFIFHGWFGGFTIATYLRFVNATSRRIVVFPEDSGYTGRESPVIYASWHGQNYLFPFFIRSLAPCTVLAARHGDGHLAGLAMEMMGMSLVSGSGSTGRTVAEKGGARAFLALLRRLKAGENVALNADIPKNSRVVGNGVLLLARKSGAPIAVFGIATSRRKVLKNWDQTQVHLPFSRLVFVIGTHIHVPDDGSPLDTHRARVKAAIDRAQAEAFLIADTR